MTFERIKDMVKLTLISVVPLAIDIALEMRHARA